jgi:hypothetical protein
MMTKVVLLLLFKDLLLTWFIFSVLESSRNMTVITNEISVICLLSTKWQKLKYYPQRNHRGPDAAAEDGTAVDTTAEDATAEDSTAELCKKGGRYGGITWHSHYYGRYGGTVGRKRCHCYNNHVVNFLITVPTADNLSIVIFIALKLRIRKLIPSFWKPWLHECMSSQKFTIWLPQSLLCFHRTSA